MRIKQGNFYNFCNLFYLNCLTIENVRKFGLLGSLLTCCEFRVDGQCQIIVVFTNEEISGRAL